MSSSESPHAARCLTDLAKKLNADPYLEGYIGSWGDALEDKKLGGEANSTEAALHAPLRVAVLPFRRSRAEYKKNAKP